jgi:hypothetical protein
MNRRSFIKIGAAAGGALMGAVPGAAAVPADWTLENEHFSLSLDSASGAISSLMVKRNQSELIGEKRLLANFRICLPLPDYLCNYIEGSAHKPATVHRDGQSFTVRFSGMRSEKGEYPLDLSYTITLADDEVRFRARLTNNSDHPVSEFWFPRIGGWTEFGGRDALLAVPGYQSCAHDVSLFRRFPGGRNLGSEAAEFSHDYPGMPMPWWEIFDAARDTGLYLGYHDKTCRYSTFHTYLVPDCSGDSADAWLTTKQAAGAPVGLVFSHVRYPFIKSGETYDTGEFILRVHPGDWHQGSLFYRKWFLEHFPFDKSGSWLRRQSSWFSSIIYQPEDRIIADYKTYDRWAEDAEGFGIKCHELIGWSKGGLERDYPEYFPEPKLGGWEAYDALLKSIKSRGARCLTFVNYNVLDSAGEEYPAVKPYTHQDQFGSTPNWMAWGESTLIARKGLSVRRHLLASVVPPLQDLLEKRFVRLAEAGADGFQIDKTCVGSALDWNPLNTRKPDEALCEGLVQGIASILAKCRRANPQFCLASESGLDRMLPYIDVYYRATTGCTISPLRYVFPEWTAVQHVSMPRDFRGINGAVLTGAVICVEPKAYQGTLADPLYSDLARYVREIGRIRQELAAFIFLGNFYDNQGAIVTAAEGQPGKPDVLFAVHGHSDGKRRAIVVVNNSDAARKYDWKFTHRHVQAAKLYAPFEPVKDVTSGEPLEIKGPGLHILVEAT